jgi:hypothetical protein
MPADHPQVGEMMALSRGIGARFVGRGCRGRAGRTRYPVHWAGGARAAEVPLMLSGDARLGGRYRHNVYPYTLVPALMRRIHAMHGKCATSPHYRAKDSGLAWAWRECSQVRRANDF